MIEIKYVEHEVILFKCILSGNVYVYSNVRKVFEVILLGKMKAGILYGPKDMRVEEIDIPGLQPGWVLIKVI
jgi:hypothetical protein